MKDEIIRMAEESGATHYWHLSVLERFYNLAVQHEREECAKVCEESWQGSPKEIARQIRARGEKQ